MMARKRLWVMGFILFGAAAYAILVGFMFTFQDRLLFQPDLPARALQGDPSDVGLEYESVRVVSDDGLELSGWYVPAGEGAPTVLFAHGNAGNISHRLQTLQTFHELNLAVLIFDYRGYGESGGEPNEKGTYLDALAMWRHLREERGVEAADIVVVGRSLGGAVAAWLAAEVQPGALVLESTFTSIPELAGDLYPLLPSRLLNRFEYDTEGYLSRVVSPVLIVHGRDDKIIPFRHGRALYASANPPKEFVELDGGHNNVYSVSGGRYRQGLETFLATHVAAYRRAASLSRGTEFAQSAASAFAGG